MYRARIIITGIVQGVGFRPFLFRLASDHYLTGIIRNSGNLGIILDLQTPGSHADMDKFIHQIHEKSPEIAFIEDIQTQSIPNENEINFFKLIIGTSENDIGPMVALPPDIAICDNCVKNFSDYQQFRYYHYPFIACAQCGPRFTTVRMLPYDRKNTTMDLFPFCQGSDSCQTDYDMWTNRRFHAETFACHRCGPFYFAVKSGDPLPLNPQPSKIDAVVQAIKSGQIAAIMGIGGIFLVCSAVDEHAISRLREKKRDRKNKPFAVMVPDLETAKKYVEVDDIAAKLLQSFRRPIVLCPRKKNELPHNIAPGLAQIGIILPYTGVHFLLFNQLGPEPLVYTSGNLSSLPMAIHNDEIITQLQSTADIFYLHNREIYQRCDDSVIRPVIGIPTLIRRSRGYVPEYYKLPFKSPIVASIAVGPELHSTGAVSKYDRIFPTQHIGNVTNLETYDFLKDALQHMQTLLKISPAEIGSIACDLHPQFQSTKLAKSLTQQLSIQSRQSVPLHPIQHHHAHLASLLVDHQLPLSEEIVGITIDGVGYGTDGNPWGGEILIGGYTQVQRSASLTPIPMIGGDLCTQYPGRMLMSYLFSATKYDEALLFFTQFNRFLRLDQAFSQGPKELDYLLSRFTAENQSKLKNYPQTSSLGRLLDAAASMFNICQIKTYQGEPAIRLEGFAWQGSSHNIFDLDNYLSKNTILGQDLLWDYANLINNNPLYRENIQRRMDLANSFLTDIGKLFAKKAIETAHQFGLKKIGVTGGVALNEIIMRQIKTEIQNENMVFLQHSGVPCGDSGICIGQNAVSIAKML